MQGLSGRKLTRFGGTMASNMRLGSSLFRRKITAFSVPLEGDNHFDPGRAGCADVSQYPRLTSRGFSAHRQRTFSCTFLNRIYRACFFFKRLEFEPLVLNELYFDRSFNFKP